MSAELETPAEGLGAEELEEAARAVAFEPIHTRPTCPLNGDNCRLQGCAWFVEVETGDYCAVTLLAKAVYKGLFPLALGW